MNEEQRKRLAELISEVRLLERETGALLDSVFETRETASAEEDEGLISALMNLENAGTFLNHAYGAFEAAFHAEPLP